jgi:hypothetical protein
MRGPFFCPRCCLTTTLITWLTLATLAAAPEVKVRPLDGEAVPGKLTELSSAQVTIETKAGPQVLPVTSLMWVELPAASPLAKPAAWIELLDGSRVVAADYSAAGGKASIELLTGQTIELATRAIRTVRFRPQTPELAGQWREITAQNAASDMVVIRKTSMRTVEQGENEPTTVIEQALDQLEGTLHSVTPESVRFEFDGEKIDIRREKLEGLVYYQAAKREFSPPLARLIDAAGSSWAVRDVKLADGRLVATTVGNVALELPLAAIAKIDFSVGNVAFLTDLEADSGVGEIAVSLQPANMAYKFSRVFQVRARPPLGAESFRIAGQRFDSGLSLHSPARLVYRVPEGGFRRFRATIGVDDSVLAPGTFDLVVLGDGKELARHSFSSDQPRKAAAIDLAIEGVRRVTIVVDPAGGQDIGDQLNLCDARFTK